VTAPAAPSLASPMAADPAIAQPEDDLRSDVADGRLRVFHQPVIDLASGTIVGAEALLRWQHPVHGVVSPDVFVALAEASGVIQDMGRFALRAALRQYATWRAVLGHRAPSFTAVNVSPHQLLVPGFSNMVLSALAEASVPAEALTLEITESSPVGDFTDVAEVLTDLADAGITLDIDDFGTGYSSLAALLHLPVHVLKIDKSLICDVDTDARAATTVRAVIDLAHDLGLRVVAEGVETPAQLAWLREHGCDMVQGFLVSRPVTGAEVAALIDGGQQW
jgi:EAL domain-containing protein (putative c-di-GMP-specific phosphodiesterase class I)